jgi:azurin
LKTLTILLGALVVFGCSGGKETKIEKPKVETVKAKQAAAKPAPAPVDKDAVKDDGKVVTVKLTGSDMMKYNLTEIKVAAGRTVKLTLAHVGKMPLGAMGHNFVLLKAGTDVAAFANKAMTAKDSNYIPSSDKASVIASTKTLGGGESDTIEFAAPAPGTYDYICSFPGHSSLMKGKLIVE